MNFGFGFGTLAHGLQPWDERPENLLSGRDNEGKDSRAWAAAALLTHRRTCTTPRSPAVGNPDDACLSAGGSDESSGRDFCERSFRFRRMAASELGSEVWVRVAPPAVWEAGTVTEVSAHGRARRAHCQAVSDFRAEGCLSLAKRTANAALFVIPFSRMYSVLMRRSPLSWRMGAAR